MPRKKKEETEMNFPPVEEGSLATTHQEEPAPKASKKDTDLRLEMMERRMAEQAEQMAMMMERMEKKDRELKEWEEELNSRQRKGKPKPKKPDGPIPMVVGKFRNFKERNHALEFWYQEDHYKFSDGVDYLMTVEICDHLNSIVKRRWEQDDNFNLQPTSTYENMYFVQVMDSFFKDHKTGEYFKFENRDGEKVRVPFDPKAKDAKCPVKERS